MPREASACLNSRRQPPKLATLYPTHEAFVLKFSAAVEALQRDGYWLKPEGDQARRAAEQSRIGR
jgi:hypothetical protein